MKLLLRNGILLVGHGVRSNSLGPENVFCLLLLRLRSSSFSLISPFSVWSISYVLTHAALGDRARRRKAKAEMLPLMPDTWCRFGGDCTAGTVLPLSQSKKVPEVFPLLSVPVFVSPSLGHTSLQPATKSASVLGLGW